jgi:hypothetical protein
MQRRIAALAGTLLLAATLVGCSDDATPDARGDTPAETTAQTPAQTTGKRLPDKRVCDLVPSAELEKALEKIAEEYRSQDGRQCFFYLESPTSVQIDQGVEDARGGSAIDVDGVRATKLEKKGSCAIDVWLVPDDLDQQFTVDAGTCDRSLTLARLILGKLPD